MPGLGGSNLLGDGVSGPPLSVSEYLPPWEAAVGEPEPSAGIWTGRGTCPGVRDTDKPHGATHVDRPAQAALPATGLEPWAPEDRAPP